VNTRSLHQRIAISLTFFSVLVAIPIVLVGNWMNERAEQEFWQAMLNTELANSGPDRGQSANAHRLLDSYRWQPGSAQESVVPPEIRELHPGLHDNVQHQGRELAVLVQESDGMRSAASIDITELEAEEATLSAWAIAAALLALTLLLIALNWLAKRAIEPVTQLSAQLEKRAAASTEPFVTDFEEREIVAVVEALNGFGARIREHVQREKQFVETMSHELRTPLAVILGAVEVLEMRPSADPRSAAALTRIKQTAKALSELARVLMFLSSRRELPLAREEVELGAILQRSLDLFRDEFAAKGLAVHVQASEPVLLQAIPTLCETVINNLIRNCCDHGSGVVEIALSAQSLAISNSIEVGTNSQASASQGWRGNLGLGLDLVERVCMQLGWSLHVVGADDVFQVEVKF